jgi:hypothetical protein
MMTDKINGMDSDSIDFSTTYTGNQANNIRTLLQI